MNIKSILTITTLLGALATTNLAHAEYPTRRATPAYRPVAAELDVIATARLTATSGTAVFRITPKMRRDGLQLVTDARGLRILAVELEYSDDFVERLTARQVGTMTAGSLVTIQRGRPPGLREVRVRYATTARDRRARLDLVQIHDGNGYTSDADIRAAKELRRRADRYDRDGYDRGRYDRDPVDRDRRDRRRYRD